VLRRTVTIEKKKKKKGEPKVLVVGSRGAKKSKGKNSKGRAHIGPDKSAIDRGREGEKSWEGSMGFLIS